jgi:hypothetical protein
MGITASDLRKVLDDLLRTDADLVAFGIDAELAAAKRFSDGMDRVAKVNLILQLHDLDEVLARLQKRDPERTKRALDKVSVAATNACLVSTHAPFTSSPSILKRAVPEDRSLMIRLTLDAERCLHVSYHVPIHGQLAAVRGTPPPPHIYRQVTARFRFALGGCHAYRDTGTRAKESEVASGAGVGVVE